MGRKGYIPEAVKADILKLGNRDAEKRYSHTLRYLELLYAHVPRLAELKFTKKDTITNVITKVDKKLEKINPRIRYIYDSINDILYKYKSLSEYGKLFFLEIEVMMKLKHINFDAYLMFIKEYENTIYEYSVQFLVDDMDEEEFEHCYSESFRDIYNDLQTIKFDLVQCKDITYNRGKIPNDVHQAIYDLLNFEYFSDVFMPFDEEVEDHDQDIESVAAQSMDIMFSACDTCDGEFGDYQATMANESYGNCQQVTSPLLWKAYLPDGTTENNIASVKVYRDIFFNYYTWQETIDNYILNEEVRKKRIDEPSRPRKSKRA